MNPDTGLFDTVINSPSSACYGIGWALWAAGVTFSLVFAQFGILKGKPATHAEVIARGAINAIALGLYTFICKSVWWGAQSLAFTVYPDTKMEAFSKLMSGVANQFQNYSFSLTGAITGLRDSFVLLAGITSWILALLGHWELQKIQVGVYNVVFAYGPILIGLATFGFSSGQIWLTALLEVSSWSLTMAIIYRGIVDQLATYFADAQSQSFLSTHFMDVVENCVFLASMTIVVPVVTGRLLGMSALGELSRAMMGPSAIQWVAHHVQRLQPNGPHFQAGAPPPAPSAATNSNQRPGD